MTAIRHFAHAVATGAGHPLAFALATVACVAWVITQPDWLNVGSAVTLWIGFAIQHSAHVNEQAMQTKLDEVLRAVPEADDRLRGIERKDTDT